MAKEYGLKNLSLEKVFDEVNVIPNREKIRDKYNFVAEWIKKNSIYTDSGELQPLYVDDL